MTTTTVEAPVKSALPEAAPFARALSLALSGSTVPASLLAQLRDEGVDLSAVSAAINRHRRG